MSRSNIKHIRAVLVTIAVIAFANIAISYGARSIGSLPNPPRPKAERSIGSLPNPPRPNSFRSIGSIPNPPRP